MGKVLVSVLAGIAVCVLCAGVSNASPLALSYDITDLGTGLYDYGFSLTLDNHDNSWGSGQSWNWLIFGDIENATSPINDFAGDTTDLPVDTWTYYTHSTGQHNGPTFISFAGGAIGPGWTPLNVGDTLTWSGTSSNFVGQGGMLFSTLSHSNGAVPANWEVANLGDVIPFSTVPEPATMVLFGIGSAAMAFAKRKKKLA